MPHPITVTASWLADHLSDRDLCIVDCRYSLENPEAGQNHYATGHIPGAAYLDLQTDLSGPIQLHGGRHPLPSSEAFAQTMTTLGVSNTTTVIAYDDSRFAFAARLWWLLRHFGHDPVAVLDGGFSGYVRQGFPVTSDQPSPKPGIFSIRPSLMPVVTYQELLSLKDQPNTVLVDARHCDRYAGLHEPIDPIAGHIPGAVNLFWQTMTDAQGYLQPPDTLHQLWEPIAPPTRQRIVYCGSGVTACVNLLAIASLGDPPGILYAGSWSDWCSYLG